MSVNITIRAVPDRVRDELAARAARSGRSLQEFLKCGTGRIGVSSQRGRGDPPRPDAGGRYPALEVSGLLDDLDADRR